MKSASPRQPLNRVRAAATLTVGTVLLLAVLTGACFLGPQDLNFSRMIAAPGPDNVDWDIFFGVRLPRVLMGVIVGAALAASGAALQAILRNPLADPHLLGISGGAALGGVTAMILLPASQALFFSAVPAFSFFGAMGCMALVFAIARRGATINPYTLLLAGVVVNSICAALLLMINSLADLYQSRGILFWLVGSLSTQDYRILGGMALYVAAGLAVLVTQGKHFNLLSLGEDTARHLGTDVDRVRRIAFFATSLLVGAVIAFCGLIGFVGLIIPHILRLILGPDNRLLLPASALAGAAFLTSADAVARILIPHAELPVGVVTTLCGGPFFVLLLVRQGRQE